MNSFNSLKVSIDMNKLYARKKVHCLALVPAFVFMGFLGAIKSDIEQGNQYRHAEVAERGSLTSCIENADVANEIEITGSSMKKAIRKVSGWSPKGRSDSSESDSYCALSLV